jgi:DNA polymerase III alpha subunit (gram-positive type)
VGVSALQMLILRTPALQMRVDGGNASRSVFPDAENHQLHTISELCGYKLKKHYHALADAEACAWIARKIL